MKKNMKSFKYEEQVNALRIVLDIEQCVSGMAYLKEIAGKIANMFEAKYILVAMPLLLKTIVSKWMLSGPMVIMLITFLLAFQEDQRRPGILEST